MFKIISFVLLMACSSVKGPQPPRPEGHLDFSPRELITSTQLLTKIYDGEMAPLSCVPDSSSAELLIRTLRPRLEVVIDDIEAILDQENEVISLVNNCQTDCTCEFVDEIFREHQVTLSKAHTLILQKGVVANEGVCLKARAKIFCEGPLFKELDKEKSDFSFE